MNSIKFCAIHTPPESTSYEILVLNIYEILCSPNSINVCILNAPIYHLVLPANKPVFKSFFSGFWKTKSSCIINGSEQLNIPRVIIIIRVRCLRWCNDEILKLFF
ncbi:hypothetical protein AAHE18_01G070200 [Arachis hypogaea]